MQLPRFLLEQSYALRDILQTLDITKVFQDDAEIINMDGVPKLTQVRSYLLLKIYNLRYDYRWTYSENTNNCAAC